MLAQWIIERLPNGRYRLKARDAPTGIRGGLLWAYSDAVEDVDDASSDWSSDAGSSTSTNSNIEEWELRPHTKAGKSFYT